MPIENNSPHAQHAGHPLIRRSIAIVGAGLLGVGGAAVFGATPASADSAPTSVDYSEMSSEEIQTYLNDLTDEFGNVSDQVESWESQIKREQEVVDDAAETFDTHTSAFEVAADTLRDDELSLKQKVSDLYNVNNILDEKKDEALDASDTIDELETDINRAHGHLTDLTDDIATAHAAYTSTKKAEEEAEREKKELAEEAEAERKAAEEAAEESETDDSGSDTSEASESTDDTAGHDAQTGNAVADFAVAQIGKPYVFGATGPDAFDCSGLVSAAYSSAGINVSGNTWALWDQTSSVSRDQLQAGDLVFYNGQSHVGIYIGGGDVVHAPQPGESVKISNVDMMAIDGYKRA
ncbi:C40 family peptidase [Haloglycomyces albus]|uniref:C40 family peptidase n=1 Tax=Haloglycomyces albus TaxID=526067 RepID=UPI00046CB49D|nr:C40 family peptidase [Haloglycomyces albus]